ncbi:MAG: L17 family ribosomal protein, partial [Anaerolineales bacterium]|nr:L17 family ribosomal protein [Anaerolineales bacterium]
ARRLASARLYGRESVSNLFDELAPRYQERPGGYTRMVKLGRRRGDNAEMVLLELIRD